ncbi:uncharacterized protein PSFLO_06675 [Pseudozyma flocculosa]|uniref:BTB domain-containing protein n=1 Tax=Pseudozyma flocculosa TaxID=84751 RepID=A0A5C3F9S1_9BASI|nr:uncharacterized protein PSFLO_06675 [Pseudozyma flocculosa]
MAAATTSHTTAFPSPPQRLQRSGPMAPLLTPQQQAQLQQQQQQAPPPSSSLARRGSLLARSHAAPIQSVAAAQEAATQAWRSDLRSLLTRAEERFADVCWTTAPPDDGAESDTASLSDAGSSARRVLADWNFEDRPRSSARTSTDHTIIWAHKAILYARAPNTFQARYLKLRSPAAQLGYNASNASLVSLPNLGTDAAAATPQQSRSTTPTSVATAASSRKSVRGSKPPSSFSMKRPSLRRPSRSGSHQPSAGHRLSAPAPDDTASITSGIMTSDSEPEGLTLIRTISRGPTPDLAARAGLARMPSFSSDADSASRADTASILSEASTIRAPMSLNGVSQAYFEATLEFLYTGEESMVDAFEFLYEDRVATDAERGPAEKQEKLRSDMTFMWRSKLYSDVRIVLDTGQDRRGPDVDRDMPDIPDANASVLSLPQTIDTERVDDSDDDDDELTSFSSHRMILVSRSPYFASLFLSPYADSRTSVLNLPSPPFTPASLHFALGFLYTGTLFFSNRTFDLTTAFQLWRAGAYLQVETLQHLVAAMIAQDFCHNFACSPPCRKCLKRVPRTLAFASSVDVADADLAGMAVNAITGRDFGLYWAKEVGNLHPTLRDDIVGLVCERVESRPREIISVLRQLSIVGRRIDTERASRWVEALRSMSEIIEARLLLVIRTRFDEIVKSQEWADLINGVGQLGDVLEKSLVMLVDSLTEARAAHTYQTLVGQVLLRDDGFEVETSKQAVEDARGGVLRYLKRRWINVRALGGFNELEKWCLKELADELGVASTDLLLPKEPAPPEPPRTRTGLKPAVVAQGASTPSQARTNPLQRRAGSLPGAAGATRAGSPRQSVPAVSSRLRTSSTSSTGSATRAGSGSSAAPTARADADADGEATGPINLRAAVLNRNAARTSVVNGHRSANESVPSRSNSAQMPATGARGDAASNSGRSGAAAPPTRPAPATAGAVGSRSRTASGASGTSTTSSHAGNGRARTASVRTTSSVSSAAGVRPTASAGSLSSARSSTAAPSRVVPKAAPKVGVPNGQAAADRSNGVKAQTGPDEQHAGASSTREGSPEADGAAQAASGPARATSTKSGTLSAKNSAELLTAASVGKAVRTTKSAASLRASAKPSATTLAVPSAGARTSRPSSSLDKPLTPSVSGAGAGARTAGASPQAKARLIAKAGMAGGSAATSSSVSPAKHAFLRATPRPGGIFSLSSTDSGKDLRQRTLSGGGSSTKSTASAKVSAGKAPTSNGGSSVRTTSTLGARTGVAAPGSRAGSAVSASTTAAKPARTVVRGAPAAGRGGLDKATAEPTASSGALPSASPEMQPAPADEDGDADVPDDASVVTAVERASDAASESGADSDAADTARSGSGSDTEEEGEGSLDPDETITSFPLPAPRLVRPKSVGDGTLSLDGVGGDVAAAATTAGQTVSQLGGTALSLGIPCIVSFSSPSPSPPLSSTVRARHSARFHATVKYIGPVLGWPGAWVGIEVALPLPRSLLAVSSPVLDGDGDASAGAGGEGVDLSRCPGGLHDGSVDGLRYFDLTMRWDMTPPRSSAVMGGGTFVSAAAASAAMAPFSPSLGTPSSLGGGGGVGEADTYFSNTHSVTSAAAAAAAVRRSITPTPTHGSTPTSRPSSTLGPGVGGGSSKKQKRRYPDRPERRQRRMAVLQSLCRPPTVPHRPPADTVDRDGTDCSDADDDEDDDEDEGEGQDGGAGIKSRGLFVRPCDVLWVISAQ